MKKKREYIHEDMERLGEEMEEEHNLRMATEERKAVLEARAKDL